MPPTPSLPSHDTGPNQNHHTADAAKATPPHRQHQSVSPTLGPHCTPAVRTLMAGLTPPHTADAATNGRRHQSNAPTQATCHTLAGGLLTVRSSKRSEKRQVNSRAERVRPPWPPNTHAAALSFSHPSIHAGGSGAWGLAAASSTPLGLGADPNCSPGCLLEVFTTLFEPHQLCVDTEGVVNDANKSKEGVEV